MQNGKKLSFGKMIREMTAEELNVDCPTFVELKAKDMEKAKELLGEKYARVTNENEFVRIYDATNAESVVEYLYENGVLVTEIRTAKIGLEEYYINLMKEAR